MSLPVYTTADELHFLRQHLLPLAEAEGSTRMLDLYLYTSRLRCWHGPGMNVDPGLVILACEDLAEELQERLNGSNKADKLL